MLRRCQRIWMKTEFLTLINCRLIHNVGQEDGDGDGRGDACDNCPESPNADQSDEDSDGEGDACDVRDDFGMALPPPSDF